MQPHGVVTQSKDDDEQESGHWSDDCRRHPKWGHQRVRSNLAVAEAATMSAVRSRCRRGRSLRRHPPDRVNGHGRGDGRWSWTTPGSGFHLELRFRFSVVGHPRLTLWTRTGGGHAEAGLQDHVRLPSISFELCSFFTSKRKILVFGFTFRNSFKIQ